MSAPKFYAIRKPDPPCVVNTWAECESKVKGTKGSLFKSFGKYEDALAWAQGNPAAETTEGLYLYVDGSFVPGNPKAGWAWVAVENDIELAFGSGATLEDAESRNIDGELEAAFQALLWFDAHRGNVIRTLVSVNQDGPENEEKTLQVKIPMQATLCHDYEGIGRWAMGEWNAKSNVAKRYRERIANLLTGVRFEKVSAHSGLKWNDRVDELAKAALVGKTESLV